MGQGVSCLSCFPDKDDQGNALRVCIQQDESGYEHRILIQANRDAQARSPPRGASTSATAEDALQSGERFTVITARAAHFLHCDSIISPRPETEPILISIVPADDELPGQNPVMIQLTLVSCFDPQTGSCPPGHAVKTWKTLQATMQADSNLMSSTSMYSTFQAVVS